MEQDGTETKISVPRICHYYEGEGEVEETNGKENNLLQRRKMLNADIPNLDTLTLNTSAHGRSCSFRNRPRPKFLNVETERPRRSSLPSPVVNYLSVSFDDIHGQNERAQQPLQRVRSFKTTTKGRIVNRGDSFKRSSNSVNSTGSVATVPNADVAATSGQISNRHRVNSTHSKDSGTIESTGSSTEKQIYKVAMLGDKGVGKTSLTNQFMTSEFVAFEIDQGMYAFILDCVILF